VAADQQFNDKNTEIKHKPKPCKVDYYPKFEMLLATRLHTVMYIEDNKKFRLSSTIRVKYGFKFF